MMIASAVPGSRTSFFWGKRSGSMAASSLRAYPPGPKALRPPVTSRPPPFSTQARSLCWTATGSSAAGVSAMASTSMSSRPSPVRSARVSGLISACAPRSARKACVAGAVGRGFDHADHGAADVQAGGDRAVAAVQRNLVAPQAGLVRADHEGHAPVCPARSGNGAADDGFARARRSTRSLRFTRRLAIRHRR